MDPIRIWVVGDSGTAHQQQLNPAFGEVRDAQGVRDAFLRYSGLGDALVTAEIFRVLLPRLAEMGVRTLGDADALCARAASVIKRQAAMGWEPFSAPRD